MNFSVNWGEVKASPKQKTMLKCLVENANENGEVQITYKRLHELTGIPFGYVSVMIKIMVERGWLSKRYVNPKTPITGVVYLINLDKITALEATGRVKILREIATLENRLAELRAKIA